MGQPDDAVNQQRTDYCDGRYCDDVGLTDLSRNEDRCLREHRG